MKVAGKIALGVATVGGGFVALGLLRGRRASAEPLEGLPESSPPATPRGRAAAVAQDAAASSPLPPVNLPIVAPPTGGSMFQFPPSGNPVLDAYRRRHAPNETTPQVIQWQPVVIAIATLAGVPWRFAMAYLAAESGGNPCAVGEKKATGPDGQPKEIGLFQIYNPDDFKALGVDPAELTAYCVRPAPGQANPQKLARPMTAAEMDRHIRVGIANILRHKARTDQILAANGYAWRADSPDYWAAVKLIHALPVEENPGFANVRAKLGRAPTSWREYRATYEQINPRARFDEAKATAHPEVQQDAYWRSLENAERTGFHVTPAATLA